MLSIQNLAIQTSFMSELALVIFHTMENTMEAEEHAVEYL